MRVLLQRVCEAAVRIGGEVRGEIGRGLLVLLGIEGADSPEDAVWLASKIVKMRIFADGEGKFNLSCADVSGSILVVSQFTLHASTRKGNRPSFAQAARPEHAEPLYDFFLETLSGELGRPVARGEFGADMQVTLINDGPVTIWMDSKQRE
jgi:D-tyrosyl-tRNA(Tyr) deacylase